MWWFVCFFFFYQDEIIPYLLFRNLLSLVNNLYLNISKFYLTPSLVSNFPTVLQMPFTVGLSKPESNLELYIPSHY